MRLYNAVNSWSFYTSFIQVPPCMPNRHTPAIRDFINRFLEATGRKDIKCDAILVDAFGDSPEMADRLLSLVLAGTKTASASSLWAWEHDHETPIEPLFHAAIKCAWPSGVNG